MRFLPLPRPTLIETPKRGDPLLEHPQAVRIRPGFLHLSVFPAGRLTIGSPSGGAVELSETEGGSPGRYGFARGFCISQVSPPGGDKPRPYTITEGSRSNRRGDSRITRRSRAPTGAEVPNMVGALKRLVHREIGGKIFQRSYHEHVIRGEEDYRLIWEYIDTNPAKWTEDRYFDP